MSGYYNQCNVESIIRRVVSSIDEVQCLEDVYHGVPLSGKPWGNRLGRQHGPFSHSQRFCFGGGRDTLMPFIIPGYVVIPYEVMLDGRLDCYVKSLPRQFIAAASVLNDYDGSLLTIATNQSDSSVDY